jgi:2-C-methyl-D-erythritol 4-phosphate cytidylyltransferase/2-C-methyl-D-erythritol 2,4-cyclodiphosphate synthase
MSTVALLVAGGSSTRFGAPDNKVYAPLAGRPVIAHAATRLLDHPRIDAVRVVGRTADMDAYDRLHASLIDGDDARQGRLLPPVDGGDTRQRSVRNGLESLGASPPDRILVHDAARPLVSRAVIDRVLDALDSDRGLAGAIAALPVTDTIKRAGATEADPPRIVETVDRAGLWRAQTPQAFSFSSLIDAHRRYAGESLTDDSLLMERAGLPVALVPGDEENLKITTPADLERAERLVWLRAGDVRVATGFDVHRFAPGRAGDGNGDVPLTLAGVRVPHGRTLTGHSDADVALHALTDALLGTLADGDIGHHFPPSDGRWKGADSSIFISHALARVAAAGGLISHVDLTLICEAPKIAPHREAMRSRVADLLGVEIGRVSVKATTTEGLGFTGRHEGIAAQATATVRYPVAGWPSESGGGGAGR